MIYFKIVKVEEPEGMLPSYEIEGDFGVPLGWFTTDAADKYYYTFPLEGEVKIEIDSVFLLKISKLLDSLNIYQMLTTKLDTKANNKELTWQEVFDTDPLIEDV